MNPRRDWLTGMSVGAWAGFLLVYVPVVGAVLIVAFGVPSAIGVVLTIVRVIKSRPLARAGRP